jgi:tripartite-type tricarboxylate transporter receptor subunit TctC
MKYACTVKPLPNANAKRAIAEMVLAVPLVLGLFSVGCLAQPYPSKPVRLIVPFPAGGPLDAVARVIAPPLSQSLGQPVVVEHRAGAAGTIGLEAAAKSPPDGHTLVIGTTGTLASAPTLYRSVGYDPVRSFAPISLLLNVSFAVIVHPSVPAASLRELIDLAKSKPGHLNYGSGGNGHIMHITGEMFKAAAGVELVHVPYKGIVPLTPDLMSGRVQIVFVNISAFHAQLRSGKLRALAFADQRRSAHYPDVPTTAEAGLPGFEVSAWFGVLAPSGTPDEIVRRLSKEIAGVLGREDVLEIFRAQGDEPASSSPEQFAKLIETESVKWSRAIKASGAKVD